MEHQNNQSGGWQQGLELFIQLSGWLVSPLLIALFLGRWLDGRFGTKPWLFLSTTAVAFIITIFGISFQAVKYIKELERQAKPNINKSIDSQDHNDRSPRSQ